MSATQGVATPDPKVIARYMQRFGFILSEMTIERDWAFDFPSFRVLKVTDIQAYIVNIEAMAFMRIEDALSNFEYQIYRELDGATTFLHDTEKLHYEIRHICTLRRGIAPPYRGDLALAKFRLDTRETLASEANEEDFISTMKAYPSEAGSSTC
jgi:hypothetical protein